MLFRRFENLIDVFKPSPDVAPPAGMLRFYAHYLKQVWPLMTAVLVVGFFAALIEVALFSFLGQLIDMAQATDDARTFFAEHRNELLWMAAVALEFGSPSKNGGAQARPANSQKKTMKARPSEGCARRTGRPTMTSDAPLTVASRTPVVRKTLNCAHSPSIMATSDVKPMAITKPKPLKASILMIAG